MKRRRNLVLRAKKIKYMMISPPLTVGMDRMKIVAPNFSLGAIVRHRLHDFRGVVFDIDAEFANTEEWYQSIPEHMRPRRDQPFYHLLAENPESYYVAYVSEQNLVEDGTNGPVDHPKVPEFFDRLEDGRYIFKQPTA
jgi:heat shock protein HspQ